jgi:hypothetical protein
MDSCCGGNFVKRHETRLQPFGVDHGSGRLQIRLLQRYAGFENEMKLRWQRNST